MIYKITFHISTYEFILYTKETSYMKMETKYYIMGSINEDKQ